MTVMTVLQLILVYMLSRPDVCMEQQPVKLLMSALSLAAQLESKAQVGANPSLLLLYVQLWIGQHIPYWDS